jgi:hypothetical protein
MFMVSASFALGSCDTLTFEELEGGTCLSVSASVCILLQWTGPSFHPILCLFVLLIKLPLKHQQFIQKSEWFPSGNSQPIVVVVLFISCPYLGGTLINQIM